MEKTCVLIKPDSILRGISGEIISRFEKKGLKIVAVKMMKMTPEKSREHYAHLVDKPFYPALERFICSTPIIAMVLEGKDCVNVVRKMVGKTNARDAEPGTIRGDFSMSVSKNCIHASDSVDNAQVEIKRFFSDEEIFSYEKEKDFYDEDEI